jgi:hypothetical protein
MLAVVDPSTRFIEGDRVTSCDCFEVSVLLTRLSVRRRGGRSSETY